MEDTEKSKSSYYSLSYWDRHPSYSPYCSYGKSSNILTKCSKCNTFQVISDLMHDFMNFNALKTTLKIHKKIVTKDPGLILTQGNPLVA